VVNSSSVWIAFDTLFLRAKMFPDRVDQSVDVMASRFDFDLQPVVTRSLGCDRTNARNLHSLWPGQAKGEKILDRRRTGEGDQIGPLVQNATTRACNITRFRNRSICGCFIDNCSQLREFLR